MTDKSDLDARAARWLSFALLGIAGWTDAVGFILFAGLYVSFMSGDATQLGVTVAGAQWLGAARFLAAQLIFIAGAAIGRVVRVHAGDRHRPVLLCAVAFLLALASLVSLAQGKISSFAVVVLAMGMLNGVMHAANGVPVGTMATGALVRLGENIADRLAGRAAPVGENAGQWITFVAAAAFGALAYRSLGAAALALPAIACTVLAVVTSRLPRLRPSAVRSSPPSKTPGED